MRKRTVRLRFTILYAALFLVSGVILLVLTNVLGGQVSMSAPAADQPAGVANAQDLIHSLRAQLSEVEEERSRQLLLGSLIALAVMVVISIPLGKIVAGRVLRPLRTITAATQRISADNLHERLAVPGPADEVKQLADTIDNLLERLEASFAAQRRFVANASHELRTPLATMRASLDVAVAKPSPSAQTVALADRFRTELDQVDSLLEGFLVLARAQHGVLAENTAVSLSDLVSGALAAHSAGITAKSLTLEDDLDPATTQGSPTLLARLVDNVISNAVVHNSEGGWLRVATKNWPGTAEFIVDTGGAVLDQQHVDQLAQPFQRLVADRTGSENGTGLGLSIVAAITEAHGGRLQLHARPSGGLRVTVSLPA